jgi:hypothetical protein
MPKALNRAWMNDLLEKGNYHIEVYLSLIEHKSHEIVCATWRLHSLVYLTPWLVLKTLN